MAPTLTYLQFHLVFSFPLLAVLWYLAPRYDALRRRRATLGIAILVAIAIGMGTWSLSSEFTTGFAVLGLPIEEMLFFLSAGLMTVNGLVLFEWVLDWNDRRPAATDPSTDALDSDAIGRTAGEPERERDVVDD